MAELEAAVAADGTPVDTSHLEARNAALEAEREALTKSQNSRRNGTGKVKALQEEFAVKSTEVVDDAAILEPLSDELETLNGAE